MTADRPALVHSLYAAFNARDIDTVLAAMAPDVDWPNGWKGGRVAGHDDRPRCGEREWLPLTSCP